MNLLSRWSHCQSRASGFLTTEACTPRGVAAHLVVEHRLKQHSEPSRAKQGTETVAILTDRRAADKVPARVDRRRRLVTG